MSDDSQDPYRELPSHGKWSDSDASRGIPPYSRPRSRALRADDADWLAGKDKAADEDGPLPDDTAAGKSGKPKKKFRTARIIALTVALLLVAVAAAAGIYIWRADAGIKRSSAITDRGGSDLDLLVMGLDSRVDVNGNPLPADIYNSLHAGDASDGGLNSNVLMYVHVPADGSKATMISIPRDDYVSIPGCPDGECKAKIKEAYGLAADQKSKQLAAAGTTGANAYQQTRDAGRAAEVATVEQFLGVQINHFIEVTMVSFFQIAQVVQPITVCVKENTVDTYSGANFKAGQQDIDAQQAMAFVRQRRDTNDDSLEFTDLDRSRRQQAFIASLFTKLKKTNFLTNPGQINDLVNVAQQNTVLDKNLSITQLVSLASSLDGASMNFYTLPIQSFGTDPAGQSINVVDTTQVREIVQSLLHPPSPSAAPSPSPSPTFPANYGSGATLSVVNSSGVSGAAATLMSQLANFGFAAGQSSTGAAIASDSSVQYGAGVATQAQQLATQLGVQATQNQNLGSNAIRVTLGTGFAQWPGTAPSNWPTAAASPSEAAQTPVDATGGGVTGPDPNQLTQLTGGGIPCVK